MLTIILGDKNSEEFLKSSKYVDYNDGLFDEEYQEEWFADEFIKQILKEIDHIDLKKSTGICFKNSITGDVHSHKELSTSCKTLILMYKYPNVVFQARFGDNCNDFVEQIAVKSNITIKADYFHLYKFKFIKEINYINYGVIARNRQEMQKLFSQFIEDNRLELPESEVDNRPLQERHPDFYRRIKELEAKQNK
ncbi:MAG: DUF4869 domain-containing protein [Lachnospiraceae bacterium]|nr:DUF4869 domain-containing protein [Lachnospiraceae bacterium]